MATLSEDDIRAGLEGLAGWSGGTDAIVKEYRFGDFREAVAFVVRLAFEAEARDHHPDVDIRYNRVKLALSTHSEGGVTGKDLDLAGAIENLGSGGAGG